jgi:hypothetical protein
MSPDSKPALAAPPAPKMIRRRENGKQADAPCFQESSLCFLSVTCFWEKLSKFLIPLSDCPFVLNRLPVFLGEYPCFRGKTGTNRCSVSLPAIKATRIKARALWLRKPVSCGSAEENAGGRQRRIHRRERWWPGAAATEAATKKASDSGVRLTALGRRERRGTRRAPPQTPAGEADYLIDVLPRNRLPGSPKPVC